MRIEGAINTPVTIIPGDSVDLGAHGVILWLKDEDAIAWRVATGKKQREINATIEFVEGKKR